MSLFLPGITEDHVRRRLSAADGNEIESGKFSSPESSAALAVNTFGWFVRRPDLLPALPGIPEAEWPATAVEVEYCARFPWSGGKHPWLDAYIETPRYQIGVESKRFEPFRDKKSVSFSAAYSRPVWGSGMEPYERMRDALVSGGEKFAYLDGAQLVKHAFGLVTEGKRKQKRPALIYIFAEPDAMGVRKISKSEKESHRTEVKRFAEAVCGAAVSFNAISYREWFAKWPSSSAEICGHRDAVAAKFQP